MIALTLIRHAATILNDEGRYQGRCDPDLSPQGVAQAQAIGRRLSKRAIVFDAVWASDRRRAWHTAACAFPHATVRQDARLRELDFGAFDGLTYEENVSRYAHAFSGWLADPWHVRPPAGETLAELTARIDSWVAQVAPGQHVLAFTHGGPICVILARALGVSFADAQQTRIELCGLVHLRMNTDGTVLPLSAPFEERSCP